MIPINEELNPTKRVDKMPIHVTYGRKCWIPYAKVDSQEGRDIGDSAEAWTTRREEGDDGVDGRGKRVRGSFAKLTKSLLDLRDPSLRPMTSDDEDDDKRTRKRSKHGEISTVCS
jgi:hypothetical protein